MGHLHYIPDLCYVVLSWSCCKWGQWSMHLGIHRQTSIYSESEQNHTLPAEHTGTPGRCSSIGGIMVANHNIKDPSKEYRFRTLLGTPKRLRLDGKLLRPSYMCFFHLLTFPEFADMVCSQMVMRDGMKTK